jgi:hypothetical protein
MILTIRTLPDATRIVFFLGVGRAMTESVSRIQLSLESTADFAIHMLAVLHSGTVLGIRGFPVEHSRYANIPFLVIVGCTFQIGHYNNLLCRLFDQLILYHKNAYFSMFTIKKRP